MTVGSVGSELGIFKRQSRLYKQEGSHSVRENVIQLSTHLRKDETGHRPVGLSSVVHPFFPLMSDDV